MTAIRAWAYTAERSSSMTPSSATSRSARSTDPSWANLLSRSRKHIIDTASRAFPYAVSTSSGVIIEPVPLSPYSDVDPYPFITRYCAREVSWWITISDTDTPSPPAMLSNSDPLSAESGRA